MRDLRARRRFRVYEIDTTASHVPEPTQNDPRSYLDGIAEKLDDREAYLRFLESKLERSEEAPAKALESGVRPLRRDRDPSA